VPLLLCSLSCRPSVAGKTESFQLPLLLHTRAATSAPAATSTAADAWEEGCGSLLSLLEIVAGNEVGVTVIIVMMVIICGTETDHPSHSLCHDA
jgi:hypothetical protein